MKCSLSLLRTSRHNLFRSGCTLSLRVDTCSRTCRLSSQIRSAMTTHTRAPPYHDPARRALEPIGPELEPGPDEGRLGPEEFQLSGAGAGHQKKTTPTINPRRNIVSSFQGTCISFVFFFGFSSFFSSTMSCLRDLGPVPGH